MSNNIIRQESGLFSNWRCNGCAMHTDSTACAALVSGWEMLDSMTGEYIGEAVRVFDEYGDAATMCRRCAWAVAELCRDDNEYHSDYVTAHGRGYTDYFSSEYAAENLYRCDDCGDYVTPDAATFEDGYIYCPTCAREHSAICSYHAHKGAYSPIGFDQFDRYIGFELECDGFSDYSYMNESARRISKIFGDAVVMENDCSLDTGYEIISQPHSAEALDNLDIGGICDTLTDYGADYAPSTAGLHLHFSRTWLGLTEDRRRRTIVNLTRAYVANWDMLVLLSQRESDYSIEEYACMPYIRPSYDDNDVYYSLDSRYCAINNEPRHTIEFRLGAGVLSESYIRNWIDLHVSMIDACLHDQTFTVNRDYTITITGAAETAAA